MLKPIARDQYVAAISVLDPAIDHDNSERKPDSNGKQVLAYWVDRFTDPGSWRRTVRFRDGERPTEFHVGIIPSSELARIEDECGLATDSERTREIGWRCFLNSVRGIEGGFDPADAPRIEHDGVSYLAPHWLRSVFVGRLFGIAVEIGMLAWRWNRLMGDDAKN